MTTNDLQKIFHPHPAVLGTTQRHRTAFALVVVLISILICGILSLINFVSIPELITLKTLFKHIWVEIPILAVFFWLGRSHWGRWLPILLILEFSRNIYANNLYLYQNEYSPGPILASAILVFVATFFLPFVQSIGYIVLHNFAVFFFVSKASEFSQNNRTEVIVITIVLSAISICGAYFQELLYRKIINTEKQISEFTQESALTNVAASVAHEINSPLTVANTAIHLLMEEIGKIPEEHSPNLKKLIPPLSRSIQRAALYTKSLIFFAEKSEYAKLENFYLTPLLGRVHGELQLMWPGVELRAEANPASLQIHADSAALKQALLNLMSNSARLAHGNGSYVTAFAQKDPQAARISIEISDSCPRDLSSAKHSFERPFMEEDGIEKGSHLEFKLLPNILAAQNIQLEFVQDQTDVRFRLWVPTEQQIATEPNH